MTDRRTFLIATGSLGLAAALPAWATPESMREAVRKIVGDATVTPGRVSIEAPPLSENGNVVPIAVTVQSPMTPADHVKAIHVFAEKNPDSHVITASLGPRAGRASLATRIRLADTQTVLAIAQTSDGRFWSGQVNVVVTISACFEEL